MIVFKAYNMSNIKMKQPLHCPDRVAQNIHILKKNFSNHLLNVLRGMWWDPDEFEPIWSLSYSAHSTWKISGPLYKSEKKILPIIGFMVLKTIGLNPGFIWNIPHIQDIKWFHSFTTCYWFSGKMYFHQNLTRNARSLYCIKLTNIEFKVIYDI